MSKHSSLKVQDILKQLPYYVKLVYDDVVIYDDTSTNPTPIKENEIQMPYQTKDVEKYLDMPVYNFFVDVIYFHHYAIYFN